MLTLTLTADTAIDVHADDESYRYRALMQRPQLVLKFALPTYVDFPVGTTTTYEGDTFALYQPAEVVKKGTRHFEYTLTMGTRAEELTLYKMRNTVDHRLKYSLCARPAELLREIVDNLNARAANGAKPWAVGQTIEETERTVEFNHTYVWDALVAVANAFDTEFEIKPDGHISLGRVEYAKADPVALAYGRGRGLMPGLGRSVETDGRPVGRIYAQGGERNIDRSKYGSAELLLPKGQTLTTGEGDERRTYTSDADGYYVERTDRPAASVREDSLDCTDIYPSRVGTVTAVAVADEARHFYDFTDNTIPDDLNFNDYVIAGQTPTVVFQSGMLSGDEKEFEFKYHHADRRFELVPQEVDGTTMPGGNYVPREGDTYAVFGIMLPQAYICDDKTQTGASWDMMRACVRKLRESEEQKFTFTAEMQGTWAAAIWRDIYLRIVPGGYVRLTDPQLLPDGGKLIRITGVKDYVNRPTQPTIELSTGTAAQTITTRLQEIDRQEVRSDAKDRALTGYVRRRWADAAQSLALTEAAMKAYTDDALNRYTPGISPVTLQTMTALIGDESLQFFFQSADADPADMTPYVPDFTPVGYSFTLPALKLRHMTLGITDIRKVHSPGDYHTWQLDAYASPSLHGKADTPFYLYARVSATSDAETGAFRLTETPVAMRVEPGYYHLLVGILAAEGADGLRSFAPLYGFTEILPGRITTDAIVSNDGRTYFSLADNAIGGNIYFREGLISGSIGIGTPEEQNAGLNGTDTGGTAIRLWAGATTDHRAAAPFRVQHDGTLYATRAHISGTVSAADVSTGTDPARPACLLAKDGSGRLAKGNIAWSADGRATFAGAITASAGIALGVEMADDNGHIISPGTAACVITDFLDGGKPTSDGWGTVFMPYQPIPSGCLLTIFNQTAKPAILHANSDPDNGIVKVIPSSHYDGNDYNVNTYTPGDAYRMIANSAVQFLYVPDGTDTGGWWLRVSQSSNYDNKYA